MLFSGGKEDVIVSNVKRALTFEDSSPDRVLDNTVQSAPSVLHGKVAVSMLVLYISISLAIAVLLMCCVACVLCQDVLPVSDTPSSPVITPGASSADKVSSK
jgi:hypothetical protein